MIYGLGRGVHDSNAIPSLCRMAPVERRSSGYGVFNFYSCLIGGVAAAPAGWPESSLRPRVVFQAAALLLLARIRPLLKGPAGSLVRRARRPVSLRRVLSS